LASAFLLLKPRQALLRSLAPCGGASSYCRSSSYPPARALPRLRYEDGLDQLITPSTSPKGVRTIEQEEQPWTK
jgi:hypothetical protein